MDQLAVWDLTTGKCIQTLEGFFSFVDSVAISLDNNQIVSGSRMGTLQIWDILSGSCVHTYQWADSLSSWVFDLEKQLVVAGDFSGKLYFFNMVQKTEDDQ